MGKRIARLVRLDPRTLPTARSKAPILAAAVAVTISGKEVLKAKNMEPTKVCPHPVISAKASAASANLIAAKTITTEERVKDNTALYKGLLETQGVSLDSLSLFPCLKR